MGNKKKKPRCNLTFSGYILNIFALGTFFLQSANEISDDQVYTYTYIKESRAFVHIFILFFFFLSRFSRKIPAFIMININYCVIVSCIEFKTRTVNSNLTHITRILFF